MFSFFKRHKLNTSLLNQIEEELILSDIGITEINKIIKELEKQKFNKEISLEELKLFVEEKLVGLLKDYEKTLNINANPFVILVFGTNGSGKTTSISKLGMLLKNQNYNVLLAAGDTFRAGATEQLQVLGNKLNIPVFTKNEQITEPAAVIYQAYLHAQKNNFNVLIADTAGRFANNSNLMEELKKIERTLKKINPDVPNENILVLDGTLGQAALPIAEGFLKAININSLIITKIDGNSKGGSIIPITTKLKLPVLYLGVGEQSSSILPFNARKFIQKLIN